MTVETERATDGHMTFRLGPVERWVVGICAAALLAGGWKGYNSLVDKMDKQAESQQALITQMAVLNANLTVMSTQLADVPGLSARVTTIETRQAELTRRQDHDEAIRERTTTKPR